MTRKQQSEIPPLSIFYDPEKIGSHLQEVDIRFAGTGSNRVKTSWYHGPIDADISVWHDHKGNIIKQQVTISGSVAEWNILDGLRTGLIVEEEIQKNQEDHSSQKIRFDPSPQDYNIELAMKVINYVPGMDADTKQTLQKHFSKPFLFNSLSPEEILFRYGRVPMGAKVGWFEKLKVFLRRLLS